MSVTKITSYEQYQKVINGDKPAVIDFYATWCGPCKIISPIFHKFAETPEILDLVEFYEVDVDEQREISFEAGIRAMPTFISFENGKPSGTIRGANPPALANLIRDAAISSSKKVSSAAKSAAETVVA